MENHHPGHLISVEVLIGKKHVVRFVNIVKQRSVDVRDDRQRKVAQMRGA